MTNPSIFAFAIAACHAPEDWLPFDRIKSRFFQLGQNAIACVLLLRHATGYALANKGTDTRTLQAYLGHRSIQSTVRYTELAPGRFKNLWR